MSEMKEKKAVYKFTKEQFVNQAKGIERDILNSILEDNARYTKDEVQKQKAQFLRKKVK